MPNWCSNYVQIKGPVSKIKGLWESAEEKDGLLEAMVPLGEWDYGKAVETWGTKWDVSMEGLEYEENEDGTAEISGWFDSAWAPPVDAYANFLEANEDCIIEAQYSEMGMGYCGAFFDGENHEYEMQELAERIEAEDEFTELEQEIIEYARGDIEYLMECLAEEDEEDE